MSISERDFNAVQQEANEILIKLESLDSLEWAKKKDLIESFILKNRVLLDNDKLPLTNKADFCSFITQTLTERNITINRNGNFYRLFNDDEKGNQNNIDQKSINNSSGHTAAEEFASRKEVRIYKKDDITIYFNQVRELLSLGVRVMDAIEEDYNNPQLEEQVENFYTPEKLLELRKEMIEPHAVFTLAREDMDKRTKYGIFEKIKAQWLIKVGETKANIARRLGYCSKYASIGIERDEDITRLIQWLPKCMKCGADQGHEMNKGVQLYLSGEELITEVPIRGY